MHLRAVRPNRHLSTLIAVIAAAMIVVPLLDQLAVADQSAAAPIVPQQSPDDAVRDNADRMALDRRLQMLEQQVQTLSNTPKTIVPQPPPIADHPQDLADLIADLIGLDQRLQRLELQIQTLLDMQSEILLNTRKPAVQTHTETFSKSGVSSVGAGSAPPTGKGITFEQRRGVVPPAAAPPTNVDRIITRQGVNIRDEPAGSAVLRTVPRGTTLHVFARHDGWVQVGEEVPMGWVHSSFVKDAP
jgi:hypothetical protein